MIRRAMRWLAWLLAIPLAYVVAGFIGALIPGDHVPVDGVPGVTIGLVSGPIHYDFLLPINAQSRAAFDFAETGGVPVNHPDAQWLLVGWGGEAFYTTVGSYADLSARAVLKGVFGDGSVLRVDALGQIEQTAGIQTLSITATQYAALLGAITNSVNPDRAIVRASNTTTRAAFFQGVDRFHIRHTCNVWVGDMLRAAGVRFGIWTPTPQSVRLSLWRFGHSGR